MRLHVRIVEAEDLPKMDVFGSVDPYCQLQVTTVKKVERTKTIRNNKHPIWNEEFHFPIHDLSTDTLYLLLKDYDKVSNDDPISKIQIPIYTLPKSTVIDKWITMIPVKRVKKGGKLRVVLHLGKLNEKPFHPDQTFDENLLGLDNKQQIPNQQYQSGQMMQALTQQYPSEQMMQIPIQQYQSGQMIQTPMQQYSSGQMMQMSIQQIPSGQMIQTPMQQYPYGQMMQMPMQQYPSNQMMQMPMQQVSSDQMIQAPMQQYSYGQMMQMPMQQYPSGQMMQMPLQQYPSGQMMQLPMQQYSSGQMIQMPMQQYPSGHINNGMQMQQSNIHQQN